MIHTHIRMCTRVLLLDFIPNTNSLLQSLLLTMRLNAQLFPYLVPIRMANKGRNVIVAVCQM